MLPPFLGAALQFHHRRDLLAVAHRVHQRADDLRIAARAVERLFDREHARDRPTAWRRKSTTLLKFS